MAGRPKTRAMLATIDRHSAASLLAQVAEGRTLTQLAQDLGVSRQILSGFLNSDQHREGLRFARAQAADILAEDSVSISDAATPQDVQVAKLRTDIRRWLASKWYRELYGEQPAANVNINLGQLHLDALRARQAEVTEPKAGSETSPA